MRINKEVDLAKLEQELTAAGIVHNALGMAGDDLFTYDANGIQVELPPEAQAVVDNHVAISLSDIQAAKIAEINNAYQDALSAGFISSATGTPLEYDYTPEDRADFQKFTLTMALGIAQFPIPIGLKDNTVVNHTQEQYLQLLQDIQAFEWGLKERKRALVAQVMAATTVEQVNAVRW
jgi:hypothetical protein